MELTDLLGITLPGFLGSRQKSFDLLMETKHDAPPTGGHAEDSL
jgi:hypothetical protein